MLTSRLRFGYQRYNQMSILYQRFLKVEGPLGCGGGGRRWREVQVMTKLMKEGLVTK